MNKAEIVQLIRRKQSFLCVGLDSDPAKMPGHLPKTAEGVLAFNEAIIKSTLPYTVAYKLNIAFYEALGEDGWHALAIPMRLPLRSYEALITLNAPPCRPRKP